MVTSAFGARLATSMATLYGCAGTSSGAISSGVWIVRTKSRDTVNTKSACLVYMLVRKSWTMLIVTLGALLAKRRPPTLDVVLVEQVGDLGSEPAGLHHRGRDDALRSPPNEIVNHRPADAEAHDHELADAEVVHQSELVVGVGVPGAIDLQGTAGLARVGVAQIGADTAKVVLVPFHRVEGRGGLP